MSSCSESTSQFARQTIERLSSRLANEKRELAHFLIELAQFDAKNLALELGYPSTLGCLTSELGLTESSACRRIWAARLLARFPQIASHLLASRLTLSGLVVLKDVLDESNVDELLERAAGLSEPDLRHLVTRIRLEAAAPSPGVEVAPGQLALGTPSAAAAAEGPVATSPHAIDDAPREELRALTLWVTQAFRDELEAMRSLASHAVPSCKTEDVLLYVLRAQRKLIERRRFGSPNRKSGPTTAPASPHKVPVAVCREVDARDGRSCTYRGEGGRRCGSTHMLEYQHITPVALGGRSTVDNVTTYCRAHNQLAARKDFGEAHVKRKQLERSAAQALFKLGYPRAEAEQAVRAALERRPSGSTLEDLVRECLKSLSP